MSRRAAAGALAVLSLVAAVTGWQLSRFPAAVTALPGTPVRLLVQDGVPAQQADGAVLGLRAMAAHLAAVEAPLTGQVEVRMSWTRGCRPPWTGPASVSAAWAEPGFVCLNPAHPGWAAGAERDDYAAYVSAHELVHAWQAQLGCFREQDDQQWLWLFEGMADHLAFTALEEAGVVDAEAAGRRIRDLGGLDPVHGGLSGHERPATGSAAAYPLFHLAARTLVRTGAAPEAFAAFCRDAGAGTPWRDAFAAAFGVPVEQHYRRVEVERRRLAAAGAGADGR